MFFRLTNSPATFQWMMNDVFKDLITEGKVTIYLDNILIFTTNLDEQENKLFLKVEKCEFKVLETVYLRVMISQGSSVLGFTNFYCKFIKNYSKVNQAFQQLKKQIAEDIILTIPTKEGRFRVEVETSNRAVGAVLSQQHEGKWRLVAFMSKALTATERNYEIYNKELLTIMLALSDWRHYLMGATEDIEIWTDHQNLQYLRKPQKLNR
ncbi:uncharacterized protein ARMOST_16202 [Armillaria ostoyae]|uniref:Reverse transcriptase RNase H-like domain-containing protein n=1 Tax=Armillaria ostoyae TaxID=47428 RepID=A0A284RVK3_ARMOS|nr:uncharacterized protein ARMOST_16202 [Armillaria ostoyae]